MIYRLVNADEVLLRLDNDFGIPMGDWIARAPQWIYQCLSDINIRMSFLAKAHIANVEDYFAAVPSDLYHLIGVEYNGTRLDMIGTKAFNEPSSTSLSGFALIRTNVGVTITGTLNNVTLDDELEDIVIDVDKVRVRDASTIMELPLSSDYYIQHPNGRIETSFEEGIVTFHYYAFPAGYLESIGSMCPYIPDNEAVKEAVKWYLFMSMLQRGYKHSVYSIGNPRPQLDPYIMYRKARLAAKVKPEYLDRDHAKLVDDMWNSHLYNVIANYR